MSVNEEPLIEVEVDEDPLQLNDPDVVDTKDNLQLETSVIVIDKDSPQESKKVDSEDGSELKVYPYMINDEILSSPDISFNVDDDTKAPIEGQHLPTVLEDTLNSHLTHPAPTSTEPHPTTVQTHPLDPSTSSELPNILRTSQGQAPPPSQTAANLTAKISKSEEGLRRTIPATKIKKRIVLQKASSLKVSNGYLYGLEDCSELTIQSTRGSYLKHFDKDKRPKGETKQEETKGEKSKLPAQKDEDTMDNGDDTKSSGDGEYVEELSEDEKKYIDTNSVYHTDLYRDIENLSVSNLPTKECSTGTDCMKTCSNCQVKFRDLDKHKKLENCKLFPFPQMRSNRRSRE